MSTMTTDVVAAPVRKSFFRYHFPWLAVVLAAVAIGLFWALPTDHVERAPRVIGSLFALLGAFLALEFWLFVHSRKAAAALGAIFVLFIASWATGVVEVTKDGDLMPTSIRVPFLSSPGRSLEAHRTSQASAAEQTRGGEPIGALTDDDYPEYRGPRRDGVVHGPKLLRDLAANPPRKLWRQPIGGGYAGFVVAGTLAVTIEQRRDQEAVVAYDAETGAERWVFKYAASFTEPLGGPGPRATPTIHDGDVYSLGALGHLVCVDAATGKEKWAVDVLKDNDNLMWGMSGSPLVTKDVVVVNPGVQRNSPSLRSLVAFDRKTGTQKWAAGTTRAGYCSPMLATLCGVEQILVFDAEEVAGYAADGGTKLWSQTWKTHQGINVAQPLVLAGDRLLVSSGYGVGSALFQLAKDSEQWSVKEVWKNPNLRSKFANPVVYQGHVYGLDDGILVCLALADGTRKWKGARYGHGQLLLSDDLLVIQAESGNVVLVKATPEAFHELGKIDAIEGRTWNYPALARGRLYVRNDVEMACYDLSSK